MLKCLLPSMVKDNIAKKLLMATPVSEMKILHTGEKKNHKTAAANNANEIFNMT